YESSKKLLEEARKKEHQAAILVAELRKEIEGLTQRIELLQKEILTQEKAVEEAKGHKEMDHWLDEAFCKLMGVMEQHVMMRIQQEFNQLFSEWFDMLIEDETLSVRLDDRFTPIVVQNGYEAELVNLSGGEKTSCALAYRLALNKVINDIIENIKTRNLIMLDEPTDGFSSEQLDKVRDVLDMLPLEQVIIVSHESKIESFVNTVIRIQKDEHESRIAG
ncbi:MAG: SMC family ATPase, partial [Nanoarchaeota archaeon]|nr:SMC family ATPase [Nanoarchaeota archaeon]